MKLKLVLAAGVLGWSAMATAAEARSKPPLRNPALLNIGFVCRWQDRCIDKQQRAMNRALKYVSKRRPPAWRVQQCNRNAGRNGTRVDWVGFDNCIRNADLDPPRRGGRGRG